MTPSPIPDPSDPVPSFPNECCPRAECCTCCPELRSAPGSESLAADLTRAQLQASVLLEASRSALYALDYLVGRGSDQGIPAVVASLDIEELRDIAKRQGNLRQAIKAAEATDSIGKASPSP